ncbi:MAG: hypothetical protein ABJC79_16375, partial [Acidimicrobiia bacterium]
WVQARLGTATVGMTVELLVVWEPEVNDFLARFVDRHGVGVHHMTFKVSDLRATLDRCAAFGVHPVGVSLDNPQWREAFIQPREAHGTVVQLAQTEYGADDFARLVADAERTGDPEGTPVWWPRAGTRGDDRVTLDRVVVASPDRAETRRFFVDLLDGRVVTDTEAGTDISWPGGGTVRLVDGERPGVLRLEATGPTGATMDLSGAPLSISAALRP